MFKKFIKYLKDVKVEMTKVAWPPKDELLSSTYVVVVVSLAFSAFIFVSDRVLNVLIGTILRMK